MSLNGALSIAAGGLANVNAQLAVVSNNVANASTPDYSVETPNQENLFAGSQPLGVRTDATTRVVDQALQQSLFQQDSEVSGLQTTTGSLQSLDAVQGVSALPLPAGMHSGSNEAVPASPRVTVTRQA